ncbi:MAG TPA: efflux RND transporter permease subunit [Bryobacteraceae bacterium]|jgi:HAE1 family hydrophobic/amphiphilic exporter-1|nr:efflux RND transporter permease subunit [Bryobacteraceae bacterium]
MHGLAQLCVRRPVFTTMLILALVVVGVFSYFSLGVDLFPKVDIPAVTITVADPGASPEEVETEITKKVEDAVNTISLIDEVRSTSSEGRSVVIVSFLLQKSGDIAAQEIQNKVNLIVADLPQTAKPPVVQKLDPDAAPVIQIAVSAPRPIRDLTLIADKRIKQQLENAKGVGEITILGGARREIHVVVDPDRLRAYNLTVTDVFNAVRQQNLELPGGSLNAGAKEFTVRTTGKVIEPAQFNQIAIVNRGGYVVKISDIGYAEDSYEEPRTAARLDGTAAVTLVVSKQSGENTVATAAEIKARLKEISALLPKDVRAEIVTDQSVFIEASVNNIRHHLIEGSILASIIIFLFLANIRTTLIAAVAIPTSIISTFALMAAAGFTLNQITMLALTLMVGIVIDDAIIVLENIYRFMEEKGMSPFEAAIEGTRDIGFAVMATTLSLLAVFLPVGFMGGIVGRFMSSFGLTSAFAIAVSLLVSFTLTPMLCSRFVKKPEKDHGSKESFFFKILDRNYTKWLAWSMAHRKTVVLLCGLVVISIVPLFMVVGKNFVPVDDQSQFNVLVRTPEGTSLAATTNLVERISQEIRQLPGVQHTLATVGGGTDRSVNNATTFVKLVDMDQRKMSQQQLMQRTRDLLKQYPPEIRSSVELVNAIANGQSNADIQFFIQGPDLQKLTEYSDQLMVKMKAIPTLTDTDSTLRSGKPEVHVEIDRARAADLGVSVENIEQAINTLVAGQTASTFNTGDDQYDVVVRAQQGSRGTVEGLAKMTVPSTKKGSVGLDEVVAIRSGTGPSSINRLNRQRQVTLTGNMLAGGSQAGILSKVGEDAQSLNMGPEYSYGASGTSKELQRTGYYFILAFSLTFIFMYIVLAAQFESFLHPITILLTLPLAVPFGIVSLLIANQSFNIFSGLGLLLLFGIVKKNAILQIDHMNGLRAAGLNRYDAIMQANRDRLRPILMTTVALVAGMIPLVFSTGAGSSTNRTIGVMVAGGQLLCLVLTLLAVPVFYSIFEDIAEHSFVRGIFAGFKSLRSRFAMFLLLAILALPMHGQDSPQLPQLEPLTVPTRVGVLGERKITLQEVVERTLSNDRDLAVSRIALDEAGYSIKGARGYYDPVAGLKADDQKSVSPAASSLSGGPNGKLTNKQLDLTPSLTGASPWLGGTYEFDLSTSRVNSDNQFLSLNPQYPSTIGIKLTQPLWRGLRYDDNRHRLQVAFENRSLSAEQLRQRLIEIVTQAVQAYWELDYARRNLDVQIEAVRLAEQQFASNRRQAEQGLLARIDVVAAQTQMASFRENVYLAQEALTRAENTLKQMITANRNDLLWGMALMPETAAPVSIAMPEIQAATKEALDMRPELKQSDLSIVINKLDARLSREQAKPRIDAFANASLAGLSGLATSQASNPITGAFGAMITQLNELSQLAGIPPLDTSLFASSVPPNLIGGYGQSWSNIAAATFPTVQVGVQFSFPIRNRTAEANAAIAAAEGKRLRALREQAEMLIEADVRNSLQTASSSQARYASSILARQSAEEQYSSEERQFQAGTSTVFLVLQRQTDLIVARTREVRAKADVAIAAANLDRATARTLDTLKIGIK